MPLLKKLFLFRDGSFAAFDENEQQISALQQRSAQELLGEYALAAGYEIEGCEFATEHGTGVLIGRIGEVVTKWDRSA